MRYLARWIDEDGDEYDRVTVEVGPGYARVDGETVPVEASPDKEGALAAVQTAYTDAPGHHEKDIVIAEGE